MPGQMTIRPIDSKGDLKKFVALPYRLYKDDPNWVPPLKGDALKKLIPGKNLGPVISKAEFERITG